MSEFVIKGKNKEYFPHVIYDYGLVEAMRAMLVKQIFIEKSNLLSEKIEKLPAAELGITGHRDDAGKPYELSETQKHMLDVGIAKLNRLEEEFERLKINKKPVMFVVADQNAEADLITDYIKQKVDRKGLIHSFDPYKSRPEHFIEFIELITDTTVLRAILKPGEKPVAQFKTEASKITAREYCNLHGLWSATN